MTRFAKQKEFLDRVAPMPVHGIGLSVDVYSPDVFELVRELHRAHLPVHYLEIFKAHPRALNAVRSTFPDLALEYHGDGLWMTEPNWLTAYPARAAVDEAATHLQILNASWLTHECASKQMAGYSFGTYLPPLLTEKSAAVTAMHARWTQASLDAWSGHLGRPMESRRPPLLLLETPPLTYVGFGDLGYADFFRMIADQTACGFVLDVGHVWTAYRYREHKSGKTIGEFLEAFLDRFPLERVIQIHVAGLGDHPMVPSGERGKDGVGPRWVDCHPAPVPPMLFELLDRILEHPRLLNLKGVALEVDAKPIDVIVREFASFRERYGWWEQRQCSYDKTGDRIDQPDQTSCPLPAFGASEVASPVTVPWVRHSQAPHDLVQGYQQYVGVLTGQAPIPAMEFGEWFQVDAECLQHYVERYRPFEILMWGGTLLDMFPQTVAMLEAHHVSLRDFVSFWFQEPRPIGELYDFFLLKIDRFLEFVRSTLPDAVTTAIQEAEVLRQSYATANEEGFSLVGQSM